MENFRKLYVYEVRTCPDDEGSPKSRSISSKVRPAVSGRKNNTKSSANMAILAKRRKVLLAPNAVSIERNVAPTIKLAK